MVGSAGLPLRDPSDRLWGIPGTPYLLSASWRGGEGMVCTAHPTLPPCMMSLLGVETASGETPCGTAAVRSCHWPKAANLPHTPAPGVSGSRTADAHPSARNMSSEPGNRRNRDSPPAVFSPLPLRQSDPTIGLVTAGTCGRRGGTCGHQRIVDQVRAGSVRWKCTRASLSLNCSW